MKRVRSLKQSLVTSHVLVSLLPLGMMVLFILLFFLHDAKKEALVKIKMLAQGTQGQIQLFMDQPLSTLQNINKILLDDTGFLNIKRVLNTHAEGSPLFRGHLLVRQGWRSPQCRFAKVKGALS